MKSLRKPREEPGKEANMERIRHIRKGLCVSLLAAACAAALAWPGVVVAEEKQDGTHNLVTKETAKHLP